MNTHEERPLGWDDEISNDEQGAFTLIPPGEYQFEIVDMKRGHHQARPGGKLPDCPKAELTVRIFTGGQHVDIPNNLFLHSRCEGMLCQFFRAIGQRKHGEPLRPIWSSVVGSKGRCKVGIREYTKDGEKRQHNEVKSFLDPSPSSAQSPPATPAPVNPPTPNEGF